MSALTAEVSSPIIWLLDRASICAVAKAASAVVLSVLSCASVKATTCAVTKACACSELSLPKLDANTLRKPLVGIAATCDAPRATILAELSMLNWAVLKAAT